MSTIAAKWYIKDAEIKSAQHRAEEATRAFQRNPTNENLSVLNQANDRLQRSTSTDSEGAR